MTDSRSDRPKSKSRRSAPSPPDSGLDQPDPGVAQLTYREAQAALERSLVELQSDDLDVERMTELYQQACAYADRCDTLLQSVEAEVMLWDPDQPEAPPQPLNP
ncbi:MAG: exodeoxyribonuclease VII small subunit [Cyanobacteriota bacterium]|nr:exodeoxyribonuclease VII small subunit [Cyanobacteriota bacterium]